MRIWKIAPPKNLPELSIIIFNWNGWKETLLEKAFTEKCCVDMSECLESRVPRKKFPSSRYGYGDMYLLYQKFKSFYDTQYCDDIFPRSGSGILREDIKLIKGGIKRHD